MVAQSASRVQMFVFVVTWLRLVHGDTLQPVMSMRCVVWLRNGCAVSRVQMFVFVVTWLRLVHGDTLQPVMSMRCVVWLHNKGVVSRIQMFVVTWLSLMLRARCRL